jgi:hypothetical protein
MEQPPDRRNCLVIHAAMKQIVVKTLYQQCEKFEHFSVLGLKTRDSMIKRMPQRIEVWRTLPHEDLKQNRKRKKQLHAPPPCSIPCLPSAPCLEFTMREGEKLYTSSPKQDPPARCS